MGKSEREKKRHEEKRELRKEIDYGKKKRGQRLAKSLRGLCARSTFHPSRCSREVEARKKERERQV